MKWDDDKGWGFLEPTGACKTDYWDEYCALDRTPMGRVLTAIRLAMVYAHAEDSDWPILDVGIGGGAFITACADAIGVDIGEQACDWLRERNRLWDQMSLPVMTFWDSIEHIRNPREFISRAQKWVFLSTPIYEDEADALASKHYKPNEHLWYFTDRGIVNYMRDCGFSRVSQNKLETDAGREGIGSYVFRRT